MTSEPTTKGSAYTSPPPLNAVSNLRWSPPATAAGVSAVSLDTQPWRNALPLTVVMSA